MIDVKGLVDRVAEGRMSAELCAEMLAKEFKGGPATKRAPEDAEVIERRAANSTVEEFKSGTMDEVGAAYAAGRLTDEQYATIYKAVAGDTGA